MEIQIYSYITNSHESSRLKKIVATINYYLLSYVLCMHRMTLYLTHFESVVAI